MNDQTFDTNQQADKYPSSNPAKLVHWEGVSEAANSLTEGEGIYYEAMYELP